MAQVLGAIGVCLILATYQFNNRKTILQIQLLSGVVWTVQYLLLGVLTGAAMNALMAGRNFLFDKYRTKLLIFWVCMLAILGLGIVTWKNWASLLPILGSAIATIAMWQKSTRRIRYMMLLVPPLWFTYNVIVGSYPGMVGDSVTFISVLVGIYRFDLADKFTWLPKFAFARVVERDDSRAE